MLIKSADDQSAAIQELERIAAGKGPEAKRAAEGLRKRKAGIKGESESAYLIDFEFEDARNWAVIHDLRIEHKGRVAQIDHLLINRWMDVYVLESKHFRSGVKITDDGEFLRWNEFRRTYEGMPSPLMQNERHIAVLRDVMATIDMPVRLGMRIPPTFQTFVLVAPSARIDRPKEFDTSRVVKADLLKGRIWKDIDDANVFEVAKSVAKVVSRDTMEYVARQLVDRHRPLAPAPVAIPTPAPQSTSSRPAPTRDREPAAARKAGPASIRPPDETGPTCKTCKGTAGEILYGKYGYYFRCSCETNTAIRFTCEPGHTPRLRKDKYDFYRECAHCGTSALYHRNASPT